MKHLDLFSGIGGFALAARWVGWETVGFCEIDPYCQKVLRKHWPNVPIHEDIRELDGQDYKGAIDIITGGFPCQDISVAGKGAGIDGERSGLWSHLARLIGEVRPAYAVMENVAALLGRGMERVAGDLAEIGYDAEWHCIPASAIGAPHQRDRTWIIAYPDSQGMERQRAPIRVIEAGTWRWRGKGDFQVLCETPFERRNDRWPQPVLRRVDDGLRDRVDRLKSIGNSIVPQVAEVIFRAIERVQR